MRNVGNYPLSGFCIFSLFSAIVVMYSCKAQKDSSLFLYSKRDSVLIEHAVIDSSDIKIVRKDKDSVILSFWGNYNDTVVITMNNIEIGRIPLFTKDNPISNIDYSGKEFGLICKRKKNVIALKLLKANRIATFILDKNYPLCNIKYNGSMWRITYQRHFNRVDVFSVIK
ncbi:hypothetical protein SAMN04488128_105156 [Chitinophaga eiseniae]|uniref:Uncharacterized protein n=1 Tax=Chitinophaga eiseniae TaxID=634771 RepID=A0A1T4TII5_9BACT|nr:hypothetical protein [Chitinophaga eiseniae]SKA40262.1 hypothetical protein SAMN04488128_105156 [Chitinophaga eiseniae]